MFNHAHMKEDVMNTRKMMLAGLVVAVLATPAPGQESNTLVPPVKYFSDAVSHRTAELEKVAKNYLLCLDSPNEGVVTSALAHIAMMKLCCPHRAFASIEEKIELLSREAGSPGIRYRAYIVASVMRNPGMFEYEKTLAYATGEELFTALASRIQSTLLGSQ